MRLSFWCFNIAAAAALTASLIHGWARAPFVADQTYISWGIAAVFGWGLYTLIRKQNNRALWISEELLYMGLVGTVVGFIIALQTIDASAIGNAAEVGRLATGLMSGMGTALYTTLVGSVGALWLRIAERLT